MMPLERLLRIYFTQQWLNLSDPEVEWAPYDLMRWCSARRVPNRQSVSVQQ